MAGALYFTTVLKADTVASDNLMRLPTAIVACQQSLLVSRW